MGGSDKENQLIQKSEKIVFATFPLNVGVETVKNIAVSDYDLFVTAKKLGEHLTGKGIEVFHQFGNILACENGYYGAWWEHQITRVPKEE